MFLENSLDLPLRDVLSVMQMRIVNESIYFGVKTQKNPFDLWVYQELLYELKPDVIVEIGNEAGGSILALAHLCDLLGHGRIIGVDKDRRHFVSKVRAHPRVTLIDGFAHDVFGQVRSLIAPHETVLVIEDSSHMYENTLDVLETYNQLVKPGGYFIVEDGICEHGLNVGIIPGPYEAIGTFLATHPEWESDRARESFLVTWNPKGFLRRK